MLLANFDQKEHLRHRAVSLRQHGFLVILVFYCVRCFNTASFASKKFGPESSLSPSPQISHQVYAPVRYTVLDVVTPIGQDWGNVRGPRGLEVPKPDATFLYI